MAPVRPRMALLSALFYAFTPALATPAAQTQAPAAAPASTPARVKLAGKSCISIDEAAKQANKDVCITAHVYALVELADGVRFLDVCPPDLPDAQCRFTLLSLAEDRDEVGDLRQYRDQDVTLRGVVRATHGRMGMVISHVRQFRGGPEKFRPNPKLLKDFNGESNRPPVRDPNLASGGRHRSFMNSNDREPLPPARKN
jgi:hypothetical protein